MHTKRVALLLLLAVHAAFESKFEPPIARDRHARSEYEYLMRIALEANLSGHGITFHFGLPDPSQPSGVGEGTVLEHGDYFDGDHFDVDRWWRITAFRIALVPQAEIPCRD